jgi:hypothetical protein
VAGYFCHFRKQNDMDDDFIEAINATADTSFDAGLPLQLIDANVPTNCNGKPITCPVVLGLLAKPRFFERRSGSATTGFMDGERKLGGITKEPLPKYFRMHCTPNAEDKRGAYHLQTEYLEGRLGKNAEENSRLWNTAIWIDRLNRIATTPAEALPPLNIYSGDKISQSTEGTGAPTEPDDEAPDESGNEGTEFESIYVDQADNERAMCVMDDDGTKRRLDIKIDGYDLLRLIDAIDDIDDLAKIDVNDLMRESPPLLPQTDFPSDGQRAESGKILRMLMLGMRSLWRPVIRAIADHATMTSLGKTQGAGDKVAAAVGRQRVIEGLRIAESIRKGIARSEKPAAVDEARHWPARRLREASAVQPMPVRATEDHYLNLAAGPVIKLPDDTLPANDNRCANAAASEAA